MGITIKTAGEPEAALIASLSRQTFYETFAADNTKENMDLFLKEQFTTGRLILEVGQPENTFLLAYSNDVIAGYAKLRSATRLPGILDKPALEIARLYAVATHIKKGVGSALMQAAINHAKESGLDCLWLCVWEHNQRAIAFYKKWGFEKFGATEFLLGKDVQQDWLMKKEL